MDCILFDGSGELLTNGAFFGVCGVGCAHQLAKIGDGILFFQDEQYDWSGRHECRERIKEGARAVDGVEALGLGLGDR